MENVKVDVTADKIVITLDRSVDLGPSASGKSINVGTTRGNQPIPGTDLVLSVNCYRKNAEYKKPGK